MRTVTDHVVWKVVGAEAFEITDGKLTHRVEKAFMPHMPTTPRWKASVRAAGDPVGHIREVCWYDTRRDAFDWCARRKWPHRDGFMHLIGEG